MNRDGAESTPAAYTSPVAMPAADNLSWRDLPPPVLRALREAAALGVRHGVQLLLYGSFARGRARPTSDLDLAWSADRRTLPPEVRQAIERLPTIRPVDLVPLADASPALRQAVAREGLPLESLP
jgi:hypothetical protein